MKNIFKKNSIIITALAIMIVIAGYISFTNRDAKKDAGKSVKDSQVTDESDLFTEAEDGLDVATTTGSDTTGTTTDKTGTTGTDTTDTTGTANTTGTADTTKTTGTPTKSSTKTSNELGSTDISDDDILANSQDVSDNGELNLKEGTPGEAVLANTADASYFTSAKINREQTRAKNKELYKQIMESPEASDKEKQGAIDSMLELTDIQDKECAAEIMLGARGFSDAVVFIDDGKASVTVNASTLTDQQLAIIEDTVKTKTGIEAKDIEIIPVVLED